MKKGYYSLLQYFPDIDRDERMNIAVMLESPSCKYLGVKYLRWMDGRLKCFDPNVDAPVVRSLAKQIEDTFRKPEHETQVSTHLFKEELDKEKPKQIIELKVLFDNSQRTLWHVTKPKPLLVPDNQTFDQRLNYLHQKLIAHPEKKDELQTYDKQYVRSHTERAMGERSILIGEAEPVKGENFKENEFDGLSVRYIDTEAPVETYWQFASFDISYVRDTFDQIRLFMEKVTDVKGAKLTTETSLLKRNFAVIIQPPKIHNDIDHKRKFDDALKHLMDLKVRAFEVDNPKHFNDLAAALKEGVDPWQVEGLNV